MLKPELFKPVQNHPTLRFKPRPYTGMWTSTWLGEEYGSTWVQWLLKNERLESYSLHCWLLKPLESVRAFEISSVEALEVLNDSYDNSEDYGYAKFRYIDFEKASKDLDAIHIWPGMACVSQIYGPVDLLMSIMGWDVESTLWLNWAFEAEYLGLRSFTPYN